MPKKPKAERVKEVKEELPTLEGTLSSGGNVGLVTNGRWKPSTFQVTDSRGLRLSCGACRYKMQYVKPPKAEYQLRSHKWKCKSLKVKNKKVELDLMVNKIQQDFARGNMAKIPHMIYEHLKWVIKAPAAHARVLLEACVDTEGYKASGTGFPSATRRRSTDLKALPDTGCMAVYWCLPAELARNWETRFAFPTR